MRIPGPALQCLQHPQILCYSTRETLKKYRTKLRSCKPGFDISILPIVSHSQSLTSRPRARRADYTRKDAARRTTHTTKPFYQYLHLYIGLHVLHPTPWPIQGHDNGISGIGVSN